MIKIIYKNYEISKTTIIYEPYGTLKSIITSIYKTTNPFKIFLLISYNYLKGIFIHEGISWVIDSYEGKISK